MTTDKKIANWLKLKKDIFDRYWHPDNKYFLQFLNFLHDRNQQGWIIDKLEKKGYTWIADFNGVRHSFIILERIRGTWQEITWGKNKDLDIAFIQAVEQLIDKENASNQTITE